MNFEKINELKYLYSQHSKHSNYQILSKRLSLIIGNEEMEVNSRLESERLEYILKNLNVKGKTILDIGGNTGFFSFELIENGAKNIIYYEGNKSHTHFVQIAAQVLNIEEKIQIVNNYYSFKDEFENKVFDLVLLLNVLHHFGDDYGEKEISIELAKQNILIQLNSLANKTSKMVFQLGYNWKGNRDLNLFEKGTKKEMIDFISNGIKNFWTIEKIGIAESLEKGIKYFDLNDKNISRNEPLGEFLNRPIFILKSSISSDV